MPPVAAKNRDIKRAVFAYNSAFQLEPRDGTDRNTGRSYKYFKKKKEKDPNGVFANTTLEMPFKFGQVYIDQPEKLFQGAKHCVNRNNKKNPNAKANIAFFREVVQTVVNIDADPKNEATIQSTFSKDKRNQNPIFNHNNPSTYDELTTLEFMIQIEEMRFSQYDNHEIISILESMRESDEPLSKVLENKINFIEDCPDLKDALKCRDQIWGALFNPDPFSYTGNNLQGKAILKGLSRVLKKQEEEGKRNKIADPYSQIYPVTQFYENPVLSTEVVQQLNSLGKKIPGQETIKIDPHKSFGIRPTACYKTNPTTRQEELIYHNPINSNPTYNFHGITGARNPFEGITSNRQTSASTSGAQTTKPTNTQTGTSTNAKPTTTAKPPQIIPPSTHTTSTPPRPLNNQVNTGSATSPSTMQSTTTSANLANDSNNIANALLGIARQTFDDYKKYNSAEKFSLSRGSIFKQLARDGGTANLNITKPNYLLASHDDLIKATDDIKKRTKPDAANSNEKIAIDARMMQFTASVDALERKGTNKTTQLHTIDEFGQKTSQKLGPQGLVFADFNNLKLSDYQDPQTGRIIKMFDGVDITGASFNNCDISKIDFSAIGPSLAYLTPGSEKYNEAVAIKKSMFESLQFGGNCIGLDKLDETKIPPGAKIKTSAIVTKYKDGSQKMSKVNINLMENPNDYGNPKAELNKPVDSSVRDGLRLSEERLRPSSSPTPDGQARKLAAQLAQSVLAC